MSVPDLSFPLLVLDTSAKESELLTVLKDNHPPEDTQIVNTTQAAEAKLKGGKFDALLIHDSNSSLAQLAEVVASFAQHFSDLVLIVAVETENKKQVMPLLSAGAHGIVLLPATGKELRRTFRIAFRKADDLRQPVEGSNEQIANFPWIIENVASKLDSLAKRLRDEGTDDKSYDAAPNSVKEALLGAIGSTEQDKQFCDEFVDWLESKTQNSKTEEKK